MSLTVPGPFICRYPFLSKLINSVSYENCMRLAQTTTKVSEMPPSKKSKSSSSSLASRKKKDTFTQQSKVFLGRIPVMVKSSLCHLDPQSSHERLKGDCSFDSGGYFVIKGSEKVHFLSMHLSSYDEGFTHLCEVTVSGGLSSAYSVKCLP